MSHVEIPSHVQVHRPVANGKAMATGSSDSDPKPEPDAEVNRPPPPPAKVSIADFDWGAWKSYLLSKALLLTLISVCYLLVGVIAEGISLQMEFMGKRLYSLPFLYGLRDYETFRRLTLAPFAAAALLGTVTLFWHWILKTLVFGHRKEIEIAAMSPTHQCRVQVVCMAIGLLLVCADAFFFFNGIMTASWVGSSLTSAITGTIVYVTFIASLTYCCVWYSVLYHQELQRLQLLKQESRP